MKPAVRNSALAWTACWLSLVVVCSFINSHCGYLNLDGKSSTGQCLKRKGSGACVERKFAQSFCQEVSPQLVTWPLTLLTVPEYCPSFDTINSLSTRWMGKVVGNGGPFLLLLPVLIVLALAPAGIPDSVIRESQVAASAAVTMFLLTADIHRFFTHFQSMVDPSGHLLVYGCGMIAVMPLVQWTVGRLARGGRDTLDLQSQQQPGASMTSADQIQRQAELDAEEGLAAAVGVLAVLVAGFIVYFSAVTASFFHTTLDSIVPATVIMCCALALHLRVFANGKVGDGALAVWMCSKLVVLCIALSRFVPSLATFLQGVGVPFNTKYGQPLPPISAGTMGITFAYDVGLVGLYLFWLRPAHTRTKAE